MPDDTRLMRRLAIVVNTVVVVCTIIILIR